MTSYEQNIAKLDDDDWQDIEHAAEEFVAQCISDGDSHTDALHKALDAYLDEVERVVALYADPLLHVHKARAQLLMTTAALTRVYENGTSK